MPSYAALRPLLLELKDDFKSGLMNKLQYDEARARVLATLTVEESSGSNPDSVDTPSSKSADRHGRISSSTSPASTTTTASSRNTISVRSTPRVQREPKFKRRRLGKPKASKTPGMTKFMKFGWTYTRKTKGGAELTITDPSQISAAAAMIKVEPVRG